MGSPVTDHVSIARNDRGLHFRMQALLCHRIAATAGFELAG